MRDTELIEKKRQQLQIDLDKQKTRLERNRLGQFSTPSQLANDILKYALSIIPDNEISFLDPAVGTGTFFSSLKQLTNKKIVKADGYDIDPFYAQPTIKLWERSELKIHICDFTQAVPIKEYNLLICNPPYVRHHHIEQEVKEQLKQLLKNNLGIDISGYAGLYCYFLLLSDAWMAEDSIAGWLVPSEFMDVNYGSAIKNYLLNNVTLLHIHRFDPSEAQFSDALVSSAIVWVKKCSPSANHKVKFTYGGSLSMPKISKYINLSDLRAENKWTRFPLSEVRNITEDLSIKDLFQIKRGLATGSNSYFIITDEEITQKNLPRELFKPVLPSARYIKGETIAADINGNPVIDKRLFLLDTDMDENEIKLRHPSLWDYLQMGRNLGLHNKYICSHRTPWYSQEKRPPAPIVCTYMCRVRNGKNSFRFILNNSEATITNSFLALYPTKLLKNLIDNDPKLINKICDSLNSMPIENLLSEGRVYGGGLYKLEPKELAKVQISFLNQFIKSDKSIEEQLEIIL